MNKYKKLIQDYYKHYEFTYLRKDQDELRQKIEESPYFESIEKIWDIISKDAKMGWEIVKELVNNVPNERILVNIGSGILEDFLCQHGEEYINIIDKEARKNKNLVISLSNVWQRDMSERVWAKVREIVKLGLDS